MKSIYYYIQHFVIQLYLLQVLLLHSHVMLINKLYTKYVLWQLFLKKTSYIQF